MRIFKFKLVVVLLLALALSPAIVAAQNNNRDNNRDNNRATTTNRSSRNNNSNNDGASESGAVRQERIRGYRQQSSELRQKMDALGGTASASVFMPVLFGVGVADIFPNFGDPRDGGARSHEGEDIMAVKGTPIVSPTQAVVLRTGVGGTEGNYVYTANPGGETFVYMHLDRLGEGVTSGTSLSQGSLIGYVGNTGNASGGAAHLHFEIHANGDALDPYPRLTSDFPLQERISYLSTILNQATEAPVLARLLVTNFRGIFLTAIAQNIALPILISDALASVPVGATGASSGGPLPAGDLDLNSSGSAVVALQTHLIQAASGAAATRLASAGATGNFGPITKAALVEYQVAVGISPATGYYGPVTRNFIAQHPLGSGGVSTPAPTTPTTGGGTGAALSRDLSQGASGEDVRTLQRLLNDNGYAVASVGAGSPGSESIYFGPATAAAVIRFQRARGIVPAVGYVGPITRAALATLPIR